MPVEQKSNGAIIGTIIVIIILVLGGLYLAKSKVADVKEEEKMEETANTLSTSDELSDIEADLNNNAGIDSLDQSLE